MIRLNCFQSFPKRREEKRRKKDCLFLSCGRRQPMATDKLVKRALVGIIAFSVLQIYFYRSLWNWTASIDGHRPLSRFAPELVPPIGGELEPALSLKPWPTISSFQPWTRKSNVTPFSCEAYFGNGFTEEHRVFETLSKEVHGINSSMPKKGKDVRGSFRCFYSETLRVSICEGKKLVMNLDKIMVSRGGEELDEVIGRDEEAELPVFSGGAFQVQVPRGGHQKLRLGASLFDEASVDRLMPKGRIGMHTMRSLLLNLQIVDSGSVHCSKRVKQPTLIVTRFEYANLFHTATDWFSAYISSRIAGLAYRPRLVLLDGHCKSPMDDGWDAMFSDVAYAMHFTGPVCFDHAIFAPLGYDTPLFKQISSTLGCAGCSVEELDETVAGAGAGADKEKRTARLREFGEFFTRSFETNRKATAVEATAEVGAQCQTVNVLFVRREDYLAHPRHNGRPESRLSNEEEVYQQLKKWSVEKSTKVLNVTILNGLLAHMTLGEQVQAVKIASVLVGAHGAGLTHLLFANPATKVLELASPFYRRPHFETMSYWMGMEYHVLEMDSSSADTQQVIKKMNEILENVKVEKSI